MMDKYPRERHIINKMLKPIDLIGYAFVLKSKYEVCLDQHTNGEDIDYESVLSDIRFDLHRWAEAHKQTKMEFFKSIWDEFGAVLDEEGKDYPIWFREMKTRNRELKKKKQNEQHWVLQTPFFDDEENKFADKSKLEEVLKVLLQSTEIEEGFLDFLLQEKSSIFMLKNSKKRRKLQKFCALDHYVDAEFEDNTNKNSFKSCLNVLEAQELISLLTEATKCSFRMYTISKIINYDKTGFDVENTEQAIKYVEKHDQDLDKRIADTQAFFRAKEVIQRLERLRWGPNDYRRDQDVIAQAQERLRDQGILSLTGWGGVGKTALAHKIIYESAKAGEFQYFVTLSSKVNSGQKEVDVHSGSSNLVETDSTNSIFTSLLQNESKNLSGSFRLMCVEIIRTVSAKSEVSALSSISSDDIIQKALDIMSENSILVSIDNFEDIEEPSYDLPADERAKNDTLLNSFEEFFEKFRNIKAGGSKSRILITTRGKGAKLAPYPVPELNPDETFLLFRRKIEQRTKQESLDARIFERVQSFEAKIKQSFSLWSLEDVDPKDSSKLILKDAVAHPMLVIGAAASVTSVDDIESSIGNWNSEKLNAKEVMSYCTKKTLGGFSIEQVSAIKTLAKQPSGVDFSHDSILLDWSYQEKRDFLRGLLDRGWLFNNQDGQFYSWRREIKKQIMAVYDLKVDAPPESNFSARDESDESEEPETKYDINTKVREEMKSWLNESSTSSDPTMLVESVALDPRDKGAIITKIEHWIRELEKEEISLFSDEELVELYKIVVGTKSNNNLSLVGYVVESNYSRDMKAQLLEINHNIFSLLYKIQTSLFNRLKSTNLDLTLQLCYMMIEKISLYPLFSKQEKSKYCFQTFESLRDLDQTTGTGWDNEPLKQLHISEMLLLSSSYLPSIPDSKTHNLEINPQDQKYSRGWYDFYVEWFLDRTTLDESYHKMILFWISIRLALNSQFHNKDRYIDTAIELTVYGHRSIMAKNWSSLVVNRYLGRVREQHNAMIWDIESLHQHQSRFPKLNKIVRLTFGHNNNSSKTIFINDITVNLILLEEQYVEHAKYLLGKEMLYIVANRIDNSYFVEPLLDSEGIPVSQLTKAEDYQNLVEKISDSVEKLSNRREGDILRFSELIDELTEISRIDIENYLTSVNRDRNYPELSQMLFSIDNTGLLKEYDPIKQLISIGRPTDEEKKRVTLWEYERISPKDSEKLHSIARGGLRLPKDPPDLAYILSKIYKFCKGWEKNEKEHTYEEVEVLLRDNLSNKISIYHPSRNRAISAIFRNIINRLSAAKFSKLKGKPDERLQKPMNLGLYTKISIDELSKKFEQLVVFNTQKFHPDISIEIIECYFREVRIHIPSLMV
jgi:hypothetical protein